MSKFLVCFSSSSRLETRADREKQWFKIQQCSRKRWAETEQYRDEAAPACLGCPKYQHLLSVRASSSNTTTLHIPKTRGQCALLCERGGTHPTLPNKTRIHSELRRRNKIPARNSHFVSVSFNFVFHERIVLFTPLRSPNLANVLSLVFIFVFFLFYSHDSHWRLYSIIYSQSLPLHCFLPQSFLSLPLIPPFTVSPSFFYFFLLQLPFIPFFHHFNIPLFFLIRSIIRFLIHPLHFILLLDFIPFRTLRPSDPELLAVAQFRLQLMGGVSFTPDALSLWNSMLQKLHDCSELPLFKT